MIHLDTSFLIRSMIAGSDEDRRLRMWLSEDVSLGMSVIAWCEFRCGPVTEGQASLARRRVRIDMFEEADAVLAAALFNDLGRRRGVLQDCMIAATAIRVRADLATSNIEDFRRFEQAGLTIAGV